MHFNRSVHGFRGVCTLAVFIYHVFNSKLLPGEETFPVVWDAMLYFFSAFRYGVEMFFMISGYVILGSLRRHASVRAFFTDRTLRIFPAWVPMHIFLFTVGPFVGWHFFKDIDFPHWITYFLADLVLLPTIFPFPMANPAAWTLSYEWAFYLIAAFGIFSVRRYPDRAVMLLPALLVAAAMVNFFPRGLFFLPGVVIALYEPHLPAYRRWLSFPVLGGLVFLLAWRATNVDNASLDTFLTQWLGDSRIYWLLIALVSGTYFFACVVQGSGVFGRVLVSQPLQYMGKISYSFYLWHPVIMFAVKRAVVSFVVPLAGGWAGVAVFTLVSFAASLAVSWLSWQFLERRLALFLRDKFVGAPALPPAVLQRRVPSV